MKTRIGLLLVLFGCAIFWLVSETTIFRNSERRPSANLIIDEARLLDNDQISSLEEYHNWVLENHDIDIRVITLNRAVDIDLYAAEIFGTEQVGSLSSTNRGLLFILDTLGEQTRIEVSGNLESVFTDIFVGQIERNQMVPFFEKNRLADGIFATTELIRIRAIDAAKKNEFQSIEFKGSIGGGAKVQVNLNEDQDQVSNTTDKEQTVTIKQVYAAETPEESLQRMFNNFAKSDMGDWDVLTPESRKHMQSMISTRAQRMNSIKRYDTCEIDEVVYNKDGNLAVLLYDLAQRECDPFVFEKGEDNKWRIDLRAIGEALGHTYGNIWYIHLERFEQSGIAKYLFGFKKMWFRRYNEEQFSHQGIPYYHDWGLQFSYADRGSIVSEIHGKSSAFAQTGMQVGDVITSWDLCTFPIVHTIMDRMEHVRPGLDVHYRYERDGKEYEGIMKAPPRPKPGSKKYRWGVTLNNDNEETKHTNQWPGPVVQYVAPDSIGESMGFKTGDRVVKWGEATASLLTVIFKDIRNKPAGTPLTVTVLRAGQELELDIVFQKRRKTGEVK
ncbi:TPM domain-containing protein [Desulforhopalus sp. 52FAK]